MKLQPWGTSARDVPRTKQIIQPNSSLVEFTLHVVLRLFEWTPHSKRTLIVKTDSRYVLNCTNAPLALSHAQFFAQLPVREFGLKNSEVALSKLFKLGNCEEQANHGIPQYDRHGDPLQHWVIVMPQSVKNYLHNRTVFKLRNEYQTLPVLVGSSWLRHHCLLQIEERNTNE